MKINFWHDIGEYNHDHDAPMVHVTAIRENESCKEMFEKGWIPFGDKDNHWYQCRSSRIKNISISKKRKYRLSKLKISEKGNYKNLEGMPIDRDLKAFSRGEYVDTFFDDKFWARINFYDDQVLLSLMNSTCEKKSYGILAYYYFMDKFKNDYEYLYITEFYEHLRYKQQLPNFEFWDGNNWVLYKKISRFHFLVNDKLQPIKGFMDKQEKNLTYNFTAFQ